MLACQHALRAYMSSVSMWSHDHMLMPRVPKCLACLRADMASCLACLRAHGLRALRTHVPLCLAYPSVLTCQRALRALRTYMITCCNY